MSWTANMSGLGYGLPHIATVYSQGIIPSVGSDSFGYVLMGLPNPEATTEYVFEEKRTDSQKNRLAKYTELARKRAVLRPPLGFKRAIDKFTTVSERALADFCMLYPQWGRGFLKTLRSNGICVDSLVFPVNMMRTPNLELARRIGTDREFVRQLIDKGTLDLRKAGIRTKLRTIDHCEKFKDEILFRKLRRLFRRENIRAIRVGEEIGDLALFQALWRVRVTVYRAQYINSIAKAGGSRDQVFEAQYQEAQSSLVYASDFVSELLDKFPFGGTTNRRMYRDKIEIVHNMLKRGNLPAANNALASLTTRLEKDCLSREQFRMQKKRMTRKPAQMNLLQVGDEIEQTMKLRWMIEISEDGTWKIPQSGIRSNGVVKKRDLIDHYVAEDKVGRRAEKQLASISSELGINYNFAKILSILSGSINNPNQDLAQARQMIAKAHIAYENAEVSAKVKSRLLIELAYDLVGVALLVSELDKLAQSKERLLKFASSMLDMAARQLDLRNEELSRQADKLAARKMASDELIRRREERSQTIRDVAENVSSAILAGKQITDPKELDQLIKTCITAYRGIQSQRLEIGMRKSKEYLGSLILRLRHVKEQLQRKNELLSEIGDMSKKWVEYNEKLLKHKKTFVAGIEVTTLENLRTTFIRQVREKIENLHKVYSQLDLHRAHALVQARSVIHHTNNRFRVAPPSDETVGKVDEIKSQMAYKRDFLTVVTHGNSPVALGKVDRTDAILFDLPYRELKLLVDDTA